MPKWEKAGSMRPVWPSGPDLRSLRVVSKDAQGSQMVKMMNYDVVRLTALSVNTAHQFRLR